MHAVYDTTAACDLKDLIVAQYQYRLAMRKFSAEGTCLEEQSTWYFYEDHWGNVNSYKQQAKTDINCYKES